MFPSFHWSEVIHHTIMLPPSMFTSPVLNLLFCDPSYLHHVPSVWPRLPICSDSSYRHVASVHVFHLSCGVECSIGVECCSQMLHLYSTVPSVHEPLDCRFHLWMCWLIVDFVSPWVTNKKIVVSLKSVITTNRDFQEPAGYNPNLFSGKSFTVTVTVSKVWVIR